MIEKFFTKVFDKNIKAFNDRSIRTIINQGGTSSSKTYSILQLLIEKAKRSKKKRLTSIISESMPHLKKGPIRDFKNILGPEYSEKDHNKTDNIYRLGNSEIEFFSADEMSKVLGPRRDILYINEANSIPKATFDALEVRTKEKIIIDFNPTCEFWGHELIGDSDTSYIHSTFLDNNRLDKRIVDSILKRKDKDPNWWKVFGEGEIGSVEGRIYKTFKIIEQMPDEFKQERYGLDFGFTNDPSSLTRCGLNGEDLYLDEYIYRTGMTNKDLSDEMGRLGMKKGYDQIIADCAEPKSIKELEELGWFIEPCVKGKDSILNGIGVVNNLNIHVTKRSLNLIKELRNYQYCQDRISGKYYNKPIDMFNHGMDGMRYATTDMMNNGDGFLLWSA